MIQPIFRLLSYRETVSLFIIVLFVRKDTRAFSTCRRFSDSPQAILAPLFVTVTSEYSLKKTAQTLKDLRCDIEITTLRFLFYTYGLRHVKVIFTRRITYCWRYLYQCLNDLENVICNNRHKLFETYKRKVVFVVAVYCK